MCSPDPQVAVPDVRTRLREAARSGWRIALVAVTVALAGCATPLAQGRTALVEGRWEPAAVRFREALAREPECVEARFGLGLTLVKLGDLDGAIGALRTVVHEVPESPEARLYLAIAYLRRGEIEAAVANLGALDQSKTHPRLWAEAWQARAVLRLDSLPEAVRAFVATSLESGLEWQREVEEAKRVRLLVGPAGLLYLSRPSPYPQTWQPYRPGLPHAP